MKPNYPNLADAELAHIRRAVDGLPTELKHRILNRCDKLSVLYRRQQKGLPEFIPAPAEQHDAIKERHDAVLEVIAALVSGRVLSYKNEGEFYTSQFHTTIVYARRKIEKQYPQYRLCSKWTTDGGHPYKLYWIESTINE